MLRAILGAAGAGFGRAPEGKTVQDSPGSGPKGKKPRKAGSAEGADPASDSELADRLRALDERLDRKQEARVAAQAARPANTGFGAALRLSADFVAAVLVGAGLGYGLDRLLGTAPWGMIVLLMLGFCAGVLNVMRSAGKIADPHARKAPAGRPEMYDDEDDK
jgi:ATP synthase protein I